MRRPLTLASMLGFAALLAAACGADAPMVELGGGCTLASDCAAPAVCVFQRCHAACQQDRDCPDSARCIQSAAGNVCQLAAERDCDRTSDCPIGQVCAVDQQCRDTCREAKDCTPGELCVGGSCARPDELDRDGQLPHTGGQDGASCRYDSECDAPRVCRGHECVFECMTDVDCPIDKRCVDGVCDPIEPVCIPGLQRSCDPCGVRLCNQDGLWDPCSADGCGGSGGGGAGPGSGGSGGSGGAGPGSGGAGPGSGASTSTSTSTSTNVTGTGGAGGVAATSTGAFTTSSTSGPGPTSGPGAGGASTTSGTTASTTVGAGGTSASSSTATTTVGAGGASSSSASSTTSSTGPCMPCTMTDGGVQDPPTRLPCCPP